MQHIMKNDTIYPTKESIMKEARDNAKRFGMDRVSDALKTFLNDLGYYQDDIRKSGFQYLQQILDNGYTEGLPGLIDIQDTQINALDVEEYHSWVNNCDILRAVKGAIRYLEEVV